MPMASPIINRFNRGELSPRMRARTDFEFYYNGCALFENFFPLVQGPAVRRQGFRFMAEARDQDYPCRLVPFEFSTEQAYVLEIGENIMRVFKDGGLVLDGEAPLEVAGLPWTREELAGIKYVQSADIMYLCHPDHPPMQITRTDHDRWSVEAVDWEDGPYLDENVIDTTLAVSATSGTVTVTAGADLFAPTDVGRHLRQKCNGTWGWGRITAYQDARTVTVETVKDFGGTTAVTSWRLGAWSETTGWPRAICFYEGRLWLAGTREQPQTLWGSMSGVFTSFSPSETDGDIFDDHGYTHTISADQVNAILWMTSGSALIIGTLGGEWRLSAVSGDPVSPNNPIAPKRETTYGSKDIQGIQVGHSALFVQRQGRKLRSLAYLFENDNWNAEDLTLLSEHVTAGGVESMAWAGEPEPTLFLVRGDGQLAALSFEKSENVAGWCRFVTDGTFHSLAAIPGEQGDDLWALVKRSRTGKGFDLAIEDPQGRPSDGRAGDGFILPQGWLFGSGWLLNAEEGGETRWYRYLGQQSVEAEGQDVEVLFAASPGAGELEPVRDENGDVDAAFWQELDTPWEGIWCVERMSMLFDDGQAASASYLDSGMAYDGDPVDSVSGLDHLRGHTVHVLGDEAVLPPVRVDSLGSISLDTEVSAIQAGLPYASTLKTMPLDAGSRDGTAQGKRKRIHRVRLQLMDTMAVNGMAIGPDLATMDQVDFRLETDGIDEAPSLFTGILDAGKFPGGPERDGAIVIRQSDPLPCTIVAIYPQMLTESS